MQRSKYSSAIYRRRPSSLRCPPNHHRRRRRGWISVYLKLSLLFCALDTASDISALGFLFPSEYRYHDEVGSENPTPSHYSFPPPLFICA